MHPITTNAARGTAIQGSHRGVARSSPSRERTSLRTVTLEGEAGGDTLGGYLSDQDRFTS